MPPTTTTQKSINPRSSMQPFRCGCGVTLGYTNGKRLVIGGAAIKENTNLKCLECCRITKWYKDNGV